MPPLRETRELRLPDDPDRRVAAAWARAEQRAHNARVEKALGALLTAVRELQADVQALREARTP